MALNRDDVVDAAWHILQTYGLGDLSMRRLARELGVQPGALYWHVANKQELLAVLAQRMVAPLETPSVRPAHTAPRSSTTTGAGAAVPAARTASASASRSSWLGAGSVKSIGSRTTSQPRGAVSRDAWCAHRS